MLQSDQINELAKALAAFQADMPVVAKTHTAKIKTRTGGEYSYSYADLADTVAAAAPLASKHGLSVTQMPTWADGIDVLTTRVMHASGQWLESTMRLFLSEETPQAHGSAITYARRYGYCAALGIVADEDDDGAAAQASHQSVPAVGGTRRRRPPPVRPVPVAVEATQVGRSAAKNALLAACDGDRMMAQRLWEAHMGDAGGDTDTVPAAGLDVVLAAAASEMGEPVESA